MSATFTGIARADIVRTLAIGAFIVAAFTFLMVLPIGGNGADSTLTAASGVVLAAVVVPLASRVSASPWQRFAVWFSLLFLNLASASIEGSLFAPAAAPPSQLGLNLVRLAFVSACVACGAAGLTSGVMSADTGSTRARRRWYDWAWRVIAASLLYVFAYFVIGGLNYTYVTHPYYASHAGNLALPSVQVVATYEPIRGVLIALSVLPLIRRLTMRPVHIAMVAGGMLFVVGGVVVLLPQTSLPLYLRVASLWEIFGQNFFTGIAAAYLFRANGRA